MTSTDPAKPSAARTDQGLDDTDRAIIELLSRDARMSNAALADAIGVAPSTALVRTRSLVDRGIITGFNAAVSLQALGRPVQALIAVKLRAHDREEIDRFTAAAPHLPDVLEMFHLSGGTDYMLRIAVASTDALRDWVLDHMTTDASVAHTETTLIFAHHPGAGVGARHI